MPPPHRARVCTMSVRSPMASLSTAIPCGIRAATATTSGAAPPRRQRQHENRRQNTGASHGNAQIVKWKPMAHCTDRPCGPTVRQRRCISASHRDRKAPPARSVACGTTGSGESATDNASQGSSGQHRCWSGGGSCGAEWHSACKRTKSRGCATITRGPHRDGQRPGMNGWHITACSNVEGLPVYESNERPQDPALVPVP